MLNTKKYWYRLTMVTSFVFSALVTNAQGENAFDNLMLSNGKIYTVVGVIFIIFIGIILYLYNTDKKLKSIENQINLNE